MNRTCIAAMVLAFIATSPCAFAHQEQAGRARNAGATTKEQKPWGIAGDAKDVSRTIEIHMKDTMRFEPSRLEVRVGDTVRFAIRNQGKLMHELVIGTRSEIEQHAALMRKFPNMEHDEPYMAHVAPGKRGALVWKFNRPGEFDFACLIAGHFDAGMVGRITVMEK